MDRPSYNLTSLSMSPKINPIEKNTWEIVDVELINKPFAHIVYSSNAEQYD